MGYIYESSVVEAILNEAMASLGSVSTPQYFSPNMVTGMISFRLIKELAIKKERWADTVEEDTPAPEVVGAGYILPNEWVEKKKAGEQP